MRHFLLAAVLTVITAAPALAQGAQPSRIVQIPNASGTDKKAPTCGKTAEECQKAVEELGVRLQYAEKQIGIWRGLYAEASNAYVQAAAK